MKSNQKQKQRQKMTDQDLVPAEEKLKLLFEHRPWETEPSEAEWVDEPTKYKCRIVRNEHTGTLCGYVGIPKGHKLYGMSYQDAEKDFPFHIHGGLTYSGQLGGGNVFDGWYFGFDTAHVDDFSPRLAIQMLRWAKTDGVVNYHKEETYRTWDYVQKHVGRLSAALWLIEKTDGGKSYD
jgi:hypothetical protein